MQNTKQGLFLFLLILLGVTSGYGQAGRPPTTRPNVIVILADDLGYGDLACYGNTKHRTHHLDRLAKEGIQFLDFHSNGVVCSPTRAALLTGKYPQSTGITGVITAKDHRDTGLDLSEVLIPEILKGNKYRTGMVGKWHLGYDTTYSPVRQGFDTFRGYVSGNVDYISHYDQENYFDWWTNTEKSDEKGYTTDLITEHALSFIDKNQNHPFFLYVAHEAPHYPLQVRDSKPERNGDPAYKATPVADKKKVYGEMIEIMDEGVGRIMAALEKYRITENTLILFISDNGANPTGSNAPYKGHKAQVWEGGHRVPAIAYWKGVVAPRSSDDLLLTMDVFPTVAELTGTRVPAKINLEGVSFANLLLGKRYVQPNRPVFWAFQKAAAVRKGKWKLVREKDQHSLYNLDYDPEESKNVISDFPSETKMLMDLLRLWEQEKSAITAKS